ncbi:MAG: hypothetical protein HY784_17285, partial [Chloroflexi bacterium]|nr:hypothetical protein [Chloroflexota bacterium]
MSASPPTRASRYAIALLLVLFVAVGASYAVSVPLFEASDELWHYPMVKTLADGDGLPLLDPADPGPWRQEAGQPPLYYWLMAGATRWIDTSDLPQVRWLNPHVDNGVITADGNTNLAIHTPREGWPLAPASPAGWRGAVLAVRLVRLLSVLMSAGTVYLTYLLALELLPGAQTLALASAAVAGFTPMFTFISGAVNNDNLASLLATATLLALMRIARQDLPALSLSRPAPLRRSLPPSSAHRLLPSSFPSIPSIPHTTPHNLPLGLQNAALGLLLGLLALTKESGLGLFALTGLALCWRAFRRWRLEIGKWRLAIPDSLPSTSQLRGTDRRQPPAMLHLLFLAGHGLIVFGVAATVAGWWYYRNLTLYGDWLGWSTFVAVLGKRTVPASLAQLWGEHAGFMQSYWGLFGGVNLPMPGWVYGALNAVAVAGALGICLWIARHWLGGARRLA